MKQTLSLLKEKIDKKLCIFCQQPLTGNSLYVCCNCAKKSPNELKETETGKQLSQEAIGWLIVFGILSGMEVEK